MKLYLINLYKMGGCLIIGLASLLVLLRIGFSFYSPNVSELSQWVAKQLPYPAKIQDIKFSFEGWSPTVTLSQVEILAPDKKSSALHIGKMKLLLNGFQLIALNLQLDGLVIEHATAGIDYHAEGFFSLEGLPMMRMDLDTFISSGHASLRHFQIKNSALHLNFGEKQDITLSQVEMALSMKDKLKLRGKANVEDHKRNVKGRAEVQGWFKFNHDKDVEGFSHLTLHDVEIVPKQISIHHAKGGLYVHKNKNNWELKGKDWQINSEGITKNPINFDVSTQQLENERSWEFISKDILVQQITSFLKIFSFLPENWAKRLDNFAPLGLLDYINLRLTSKMQSFTEGKMIIKSKHVAMENPTLYQDVLAVKDLATKLEWRMLKEGVEIKVKGLKALIDDAKLVAEGRLIFSKEKKLPDIEMVAHLGNMTTQTALQRLPRKKMHVDLTKWLDSSILAGNIRETTLLIRGNWEDFPFDNVQGVIEVYSKLANVQCDYAKSWPALSELEASLFFHNRSLFISTQGGNIAGNQLIDFDAVIPDVIKKPALIVDAKVASHLQEGINVISESPLQARLGKMLSSFHFTGPMLLSLGLEIPLRSINAPPFKVRGLIELENAKVILPRGKAVTHLKGSVSFTENSLRSNNLVGNFLNSPTRFSIESQTLNEAQVKLMAQGKLKITDLSSLIPVPAEMLKNVNGVADYAAQFTVAKDMSQGDLNVSSTLQGVSIEAPSPFAKTAEEIRPFECTMNFEPNALVRMMVKYGDDINAALSLKMREGAWQPMGAHLHFGQKRLAKFREDEVLLVDGEIKMVDFLDWKARLTKKEDLGIKPMGLEPLMSLTIENFKLYGLLFPQEKVEVQRVGGTHIWNVSFKGAALEGRIFYPEEQDKAISIDFDKVILTNKEEVADFSPQDNTKPLDIKIKELILDKKVIQDIGLRLEPSWKGYFFPYFKAKLKETDIHMSGNWDYLGPITKVTANGKIITKNMGSMLSSLGMEGSIRQANGIINLSLEWNGSPAKIDMPSLVGQADLALKSGVIHGVNPGIGRVLSLLNLDNIHRRLNLDFSDVTKKGMVFDELSGKFQFGKGKVSSNKIMFNTPSAKIEAFGQADMINQALDGEMMVMPDVTGSLPVAAAIAAGNPAVGAAVWVVDKILGNKIQRIHRLRYKVLGTWQAPLVQEVPLLALRKG